MGRKRKSSAEKQRVKLKYMKKIRSDPSYKLHEQESNKIAMRTTREEMEYRKKERTRIASARKDDDYKKKERLRKAAVRENVEYKEQERLRIAAIRESFEYKEQERVRIAAIRENVEYKEQERIRMAAVRQDDQYKDKERARNAETKRQIRGSNKRIAPWEKSLIEFAAEIREGPTHVCACCGGLWYLTSLDTVTADGLMDYGCNDVFIGNVLLVKDDGGFKLCGTCKKHICCSKPTVPKMCLSNGFAYPPVPEILKCLTRLEERLVSPRIPFMQIRELGYAGQHGIHGSVVNVPNDMDICSRVLPRNVEETSRVQVMFMRRMSYKTPYIHETIRPSKVYAAAQYLSTMPLYQKEGIILSDDWKSSTEVDTFEVENLQDDDLEEVDVKHCKSEATPITEVNPIDEESDDEQEQLNPGGNETLLLQDDDGFLNRVVRIAPGEGQKPLSLLMDLEAEVLSFPKIYAGVSRNFKPSLRITYTDIAKSEARRYDRRACGHEKLLYSCKLSQTHRVISAIALCLRKKKGGQNVKAGQIKSESHVESLIAHDDGYRCLKGIRNSPAHLEDLQKKIMGMMRQFGIPTFFITLSAAETKWPELLVNLNKILNNKNISEEEATALSFADKCTLIRSDPITCARNFEHRSRVLMKTLLNTTHGIFSPFELEDYFQRIEFQHRGSPHSHGLYWVKDAPAFDPENMESFRSCCTFIDEFITCKRTGDEDLESVIQYQLHKHSHTCKRKSEDGTVCRFGLPIPPMPDTCILLPLPKDYSPELLKLAKLDFKKIKTKLHEMGRQFKEDLPFQTFLEELKLTQENYILAVRSSLRRVSVFLKRATNAIFVNAYNEKLLKAWRANMDIQFILDPFACAKYCVQYISKSNGGMSKLMRDVCQEIKKGNLSLKERLRKFVNAFMNSSEISAQEAAYWVLSLPLSTCSRDSIYINTSPPEERVFLVKPREELNELTDDSEDISVKGMLDHYIARPKGLEEISLAEFAAFYNFRKSGNQSKSDSSELIDGSGFVTKRRRAKVVRFRKYLESLDPTNYYRESCMLYVPWRCEEKELLNVDCEVKYNQNIDTIQTNRRILHYNDLSDHIESAFEEINDGEYEDIVPTKRFDIVEDQFDVFEEMSGKKENTKVDYLVPLKQVPDDEYWNLVRALNEKQRKYFLHVIHSLKTKEDTFYDFVTGGAGVGKSHLITAIIQTLLRIFSKVPGICLESVFVLVCASTGKAAFNIRGVTLHCAFRLPPSQYGGKLAKLPESVCNSLRVKLRHLKLVVIDEISMVSLKHLYQINERLKQIFGVDKLFGGIPFTVVGDFYQIRPVFARFVFQELTDSPLQAIIGNILWELFQMFELTEVMRQKGDLEFAMALNNMAKGCMTPDDVNIIQSRQLSNGLVPPVDAIRLFWTNEECNMFNAAMQASLFTEEARSDAFDQVQGSGTESQKNNLLEYAKTFSTQEADGMPLTVNLKVGAMYMVSTNVDVPDGLFNGATGTLKLIECGTNSDGERIPIRAYMEFGDPLIGSGMRCKFRGLMQSKKIDLSWTPISLTKKELKKTGVNKNLQVVRRQIPLIAANGITITKSQGSTYKKVVVKIKKRLPRDQLYVACSRSQTADGLFIDGEFVAPPPPPEFILKELQRLRDKGFELSLRFLQDVPNTHYKVIFHNVQSLHKHYLDVSCDLGYTSADIIACIEPWTFENENYELNGFEYLHRHDCSSTRDSKGSVVYAKPYLRKILLDSSYLEFSSGSGGHYNFTSWKLDTVNCLMSYRSPKSVIQEYLTQLDQILSKYEELDKLLVFGDFNMDLNNKDGNQLKQLFSKYGLQSLMPDHCSSTDGGSQIDGVFSNLCNVEAWFYESIFSYHKPICIIWPKDAEAACHQHDMDCDEGSTPADIKHQVNIETADEKTQQLPMSMNSLTISCDDMNKWATLSLKILQQIWTYYGSQQLWIKDVDDIRHFLDVYSAEIESMKATLGSQQHQVFTSQICDRRSVELLPRAFKKHYTPVYTSPDGNCFYNALSIALTGTEKNYCIVKLAILSDILNNEIGYTFFAQANFTTYEELVQVALREKEYADEKVAYAAAKVLKRPIHSYDMDFGRCSSYADDQFMAAMEDKKYVPHRYLLFDDSDKARRPVCIHHRNMHNGGTKNHFVCLMPMNLEAPVFPANQDYYSRYRRFGADVPTSQ